MEQYNHHIDELNNKMSKTIDDLKRSFTGLRTGRASASLLDKVQVEAYENSKVPINQVATVSVPDSRVITVQVWDKSVVKHVEKAIQNANLGLNPMSEGNIVRVMVPDLSEERRVEIVKKASEYCENAKISVRNLRRNTVDLFKKMKKNNEISEDIVLKMNKVIQNVTDDFVERIGTMFEEKKSEIMKV